MKTVVVDCKNKAELGGQNSQLMCGKTNSVQSLQSSELWCRLRGGNIPTFPRNSLPPPSAKLRSIGSTRCNISDDGNFLTPYVIFLFSQGFIRRLRSSETRQCIAG